VLDKQGNRVKRVFLILQLIFSLITDVHISHYKHTQFWNFRYDFRMFQEIFRRKAKRLPRELGWKHWQKTQIDTNNTVDEYSETGFFFCLNFLLLWYFRYRVAHARRSKLTAQRVPRNWTTERSALGFQVSRYCAKRVA